MTAQLKRAQESHAAELALLEEELAKGKQLMEETRQASSAPSLPLFSWLLRPAAAPLR